MPEKISESISVVLPVYNEVTLLEPTIKHCLEVLSHDFEDFELILVDDGSTDGTGAVMERLAKNDPRIHLIHNYINLNLGISLLRGMVIATKNFVTWNAVDLPLAMEDIARLIPYMKDCDVFVQERKSHTGYTLWRWMTSQINRFLLRLLFGCSDIKDMNFTQIYRRSIILRILPISRSPAFAISEIILRAKRIGLRVKTISIDYHKRLSGKGAFGKPHDILWSMYDMMRFRFKVWQNLKR